MKKTTTSFKKLPLNFVSVLLLFLVNTFMAQPTCTLDPVFVASPNYGIWPDSATNFVSGQVGVSYAQNITVKVPLDTMQNPVKICFTRFELLAPPSYPNYNLPPGLILTGTPSNLQFPGNANSCAIISGTPTTAGTYTLYFQVDVYGNTILSFQTCPTPVNPNTGSKISTQNINYYIINIAPVTDVKENSLLNSISVYPNPASDKIHLTFTTKTLSALDFTLTDITGKIIIYNKLETIVGENKTSIDVSQLQSGIYFYTLSSQQESIRQKIIINK